MNVREAIDRIDEFVGHALSIETYRKVRRLVGAESEALNAAHLETVQMIEALVSLQSYANDPEVLFWKLGETYYPIRRVKKQRNSFFREMPCRFERVDVRPTTSSVGVGIWDERPDEGEPRVICCTHGEIPESEYPRAFKMLEWRKE